MPLPPNDPRRRNIPQVPVASGNRRGVGFRLLPGATSFRGVPIHQDQRPFGDARMGDAGQATISVEQAAVRYPDFAKGHNLKAVDQYLVGLWRARKIPGLTPKEHETFDGIPTAEEWYDVAFSEDRRVINSWAELNATPSFDPGTFDLGAAFAALDPDAQDVVRSLIQVLAAKGAGQ